MPNVPQVDLNELGRLAVGTRKATIEMVKATRALAAGVASMDTSTASLIKFLSELGGTTPGDPINPPPAPKVVLTNSESFDSAATEHAPIISSWHIDRDNDGQMDTLADTRVAAHLDTVYPDVEEPRWIVIDVEGTLFNLATTGRISSACDNYSVMRDLVHTIRPNAKITLYGVPMYWGRNVAQDNWREFTRELCTRRLVDALMQDEYIQSLPMTDEARKLEWLDFGVSVAREFEIPHFCYVTERTHAFERIPRDVLRAWFRKILGVSDGLIVWSGTGWYSRRAAKRDANGEWVYNDARMQERRNAITEEIGPEWWLDAEKWLAWEVAGLTELHEDAVTASKPPPPAE